LIIIYYFHRASNNQQLKMQQLDFDKLLDMTGIQFSLVYSREPSLFVIQKLQRVKNKQTNMNLNRNKHKQHEFNLTSMKI